MYYLKFETLADLNAAQAKAEAKATPKAQTLNKGVLKNVLFSGDYYEKKVDSLILVVDEEGLKEVDVPYVSIVSYTEWGKRFDAVASLKKLVAESPISVDLGGGKILPLQSMIEDWYVSKTTQVSSFMETGDSAFLKSIETSEDFWWDADGSNGTVREQAVAIVEPLVIV